MLPSVVPSVKELLNEGARKFGEATFIKYVRNGEVKEKSFIQIRDDSECVCRMIRHTVDKRIHIAVIGKTSYEYLVFCSGVLSSGNVFVPFSPEISVVEAADLFDRADIEDTLFFSFI